MGIRSATKKKLVELGVSEGCAKKLALDRTFSDIKSMTPAQIRQVTDSSPEQGIRIHEQLITWDSHDITRRVNFRSAMNRVSVCLITLKETIESQTAENELIDVSRLLRDEISKSSSEVHKDEFENEVQRAKNDSDDVFTPLQKGVFLELFPEDHSNSIRAVRHLIAKKVEVPMCVMEGYHIHFRSDYQVRLTIAVTEISEEELKAVTDGLVECGMLDLESAQPILDNLDLAHPYDAPQITKGDTVIEKFPMKIPRKRDPLDKHPDDSRWPSHCADMVGKVIHRLCFGTLVVEFEENGRPREFIHECHCKLLPSSRENPNHGRHSPF